MTIKLKVDETKLSLVNANKLMFELLKIAEQYNCTLETFADATPTMGEFNTQTDMKKSIGMGNLITILLNAANKISFSCEHKDGSKDYWLVLNHKDGDKTIFVFDESGKLIDIHTK